MKKIFLSTAMGLVLSACSSPQGANQPVEIWSNFEQSTVNSQKLGENQSLAVFYRQNNVQGAAVNMYVNGEYQASLLPNAYSSVAVCSTKNLFASSFSSTKDFGNSTQGVRYTMPVNSVTYFKVIQYAKDKVKLVHVDNAVAEQEVAQLPRENQTLSRVNAQDCNDAVYGKK
ncbi:hypothetical protein D3M79_03760 [Rodentibacter pneumotropicus]|uniref:Lipoprotein n=1 Tax=Rodentibacter pneumotropicus TaxID=758 RepID=A0A4S2P633_9PAST|nr:hypothetical protein [Rodentibacter pneumotropicus]TGZ98377.1 hypothetical protein D3M74_10820 [Rodentibacter pneumotropicus]THA00628.1 hypothetical protein D3M79_03760 [Rodentibacter pneumotropicus]THA04878.1 hypothetical protein D3M77_10470 [Rodentibacter pneumotropicus]THA10627.1 hypothetical protein D3M76_11775 [Rodentibacter pneumotropicus]